MTFRQDELDIPRLGTEATGATSAEGPSTEPPSARQRNQARVFKASATKQQALWRAPRGLVTTLIVAAIVSGAVSVVLGYKVHPAAGAHATVGPLAKGAGIQAGQATSKSEPPSAATLPMGSTPEPGRWDSRVAVDRGDFASMAVSERALETAPPKRSSSASALRVPTVANQVSAEVPRKPSGRAAPTARISILDAPIAPPED